MSVQRTGCGHVRCAHIRRIASRYVNVITLIPSTSVRLWRQDLSNGYVMNVSAQLGTGLRLPFQSNLRFADEAFIAEDVVD
jgi:hypothetical protein